VRALTILTALAALALGGCGAAGPDDDGDAPISTAAVRTEPASEPSGELPCGDPALPADANCPGPAPARPVAVSPSGSVADYEAEYWASDETDTENGLWVVSDTAPGTFALTGIVQDAEARQPVRNATVRLARSDGRAPALTTLTGTDGAFAFVDVPAALPETCFDLFVRSPGLGTFSHPNDPVAPDETYQVTIDLYAGERQVVRIDADERRCANRP
jgi:hypothetical protein